ncbi:MAG: S-layer homology domain-containing protein [Caldisericaceae bacterium]
MKIVKKVVSSLLVLVMFLLNFSFASRVVALDSSIFNDATASRWAISELTQAYNYGLTYPDIMGKFQQPITREEFCVIVVKMYTKLTNKTVTAGTSPFSDTSNPEIVKAYQLGIVNGTGGGKFSPTLSITRQEIATMIYRALSKAFTTLPQINKINFPFKDKDKIASWALQSMMFAYQNGIMKGVTSDTIEPLSNTTREQGIILVKRTYENFRTSINATLQILPTPAPTSEAEKFRNLDFNALINAPKYDTKSILYVANDSTKPLSIPKALSGTTKGSLYTRADDGALVDMSGNKQRYFYADYGTLTPYAIVVQVSKAPFVGFKTNWNNPPALVYTTTISPAKKEFVIDFSKFVGAPPILIINTTPKTESAQVYYVRAVPVDKNMNCIGDPGEGLRVLYGKPGLGNQKLSQITVNGKPSLIKMSFELWTTQRDGDITCNGEFPNKLQHLSEVGFNSEDTSDTARWFQFKNFPEDTTKIVLEVASKPFDGSGSIDNPSGLVYLSSYIPPIPEVACTGTENSVPVKFHNFAPASSTLKAGDSIAYYVRAVAYSKSASAGSLDYALSDVVKVNYYKQQSITFFMPKTVNVPTYIPSVKIIHYEPVQWQDPNWAHYYVVYRNPHWNEVNFEVTNGVDTLHPYMYYFENDFSMTPERYEKEILSKWLAVGDGIQIWDRPKDESFWGQLWDGIVSFFKSLINVIAQLTNWVSQAYASLKSGLINFVVSSLPGLPDSWRNALKTALTALVDYGLASLGIPPELPNFDALEKDGLDYLAKEALTEAGVPATDMTVDLVEKTAKGIGDNLAASANSATPNPLNCPFLKANPMYLYRPAYMDIQITNNYDKPSQPGKLNIDVQWEWHEWNSDGGSITLSSPLSTFANGCPDAALQEGVDYRNHFLNGLKNGYPYFPVYYPIFEPVRSISIPALNPHESTTVRVYFKEYIGKPYPFAPNGQTVNWDDFANLYGMAGAVGPSQFKVYTNGFTLPTLPKTYCDEATHTMYTYAYDTTSTSDSFTGVPKKPYSH